MKKYISAFIFFGLTGCNHVEKHMEAMHKDSIPVTKTSPLNQPAVALRSADGLLDSLQKISFVQESNRHIDSLTHHQHGISFIIDSTEKKEWMIQAGYNGKDRFETYHRFFVNIPTMDIKVYDVINDEKLSLVDYLKKEK